MTELNPSEEITRLTALLNYHNIKYYVEDEPEISDFEYDALLRKLEEMENAYPQYAKPDSPTKRVGGYALSQFTPVEHRIKMESLQDVFSYEELKGFLSKIDLGKTKLSVEPKIDGLSVSLEYTGGVLKRASTRGDGLVGEDITLNALNISSIPKTIPFKGELEVRGEVYMPVSSFEMLCAQQEINGEKTFKNPRNAAAGSLRQKKAEITKKRNLNIFIFNLQYIENKIFSSHIQTLDFLKEQGFNVLPMYSVCKSYDEAIEKIEYIANTRGEWDFDIDGAVIKSDSLVYRDELGSTAKYPKWAVAYKYPPEEKQTNLLNITIQVGRTGVLTPIAEFEPVQLSGTTVSRATLHNQDFITEKGICIGDTITVRKAGEIIPEVVAVVFHCEEAKPYTMPNICPSCGSTVFRDDDESAIRCTNADCPSQLLRNIVHFASRDAMDIEGLGPAMVEMLVDNNLIHNILDIYNLKTQDIKNLDRMGEKSAENLISAIEKSKGNDVGKLIFGLGIHHIGAKAADILAEHFNNLEALMDADINSLVEIEGFGKIMAQSVVEFFSVEENVLLCKNLLNMGVNGKCLKKITDERFKGITFVLTGTLPTYSRSEASAIIEQFGGKTSSSVSKKTGYVLAGDEAGSKLDKANALGVKVISEADFIKMIK